MENYDFEMPTPCQHCGEIFDLNDGFGSEKWYPNIVICEECYRKEEEEIEEDDRWEDINNEISNALYGLDKEEGAWAKITNENRALIIQLVSGSASASDSDPQIDYHMHRIKAVNNYIKDKGNLVARVFLRATGAINNHDGTYTIQEQDIKQWFESGSHLTAFTEYDTM